ncbi:MAG: hypothetical protein C0434_15070, partial [Xanthomonadaceae bacterium]|nr:hypothetical protein [Xanthomonadaceae bacterium]
PPVPRAERGRRPALDSGAAKVVGRSASIELARGEQQLIDAEPLLRPAFERDNASLRQRYGGLRDDEPLSAGAPLASRSGAIERLGDDASAQRVSAAVRGRGTAAIRAGDLTRVEDGSAIQATALLCARNGGQPLLRRLTVAGDGALAPKAALVIQGQCFGDAAGTVRVILPTAYGPIRSVDAQVVDWQAGKIFAVLPDVDRVIPGQATVEVITTGGQRGGSAPLAFEPAWELRPRSIPATTGRIDGCAGGGYYSRCVMVFAGHEIDLRDPQFELAATCRASGLPAILDPLGLSNAFVSCNGKQGALGEGLQGQVLAQHNSGGEDLRDSISRSDVYQLQLPPYARLAALRYQSRAFPGRGRIDAPRFDPASGQLVVAWSMVRDGAAEPGLIEYAIDFDTLWPRGVDR